MCARHHLRISNDSDLVHVHRTQVKKLLNIESVDRASSVHGYSRVVRGTGRHLEPQDVKSALVMGVSTSQGWNATVDRLLHLNTNLYQAKVNSSEVQCHGLEVIPCLLQKQMMAMIYFRESQRFKRIIGSIEQVLKAEDGSVTQELALRDAYKDLREQTLCPGLQNLGVENGF